MRALGPGVAPNRDKVGQWLGGLAARHAVSRVELRHAGIEDRTRPVEAWDLEGKATAVKVASLADAVGLAAQEDAAGLGGTQRYVVIAFAGDKPIGSKPIREIASAEWQPGDPLDTEPPNGTGLVAQAQRHLEVQTRTMAMMLGGAFATMQREMTRISERNEVLEARHAKMLGDYEAVISEAKRRELDEMKAKADISQKERLLQTGLALAAHAANKITGKAILPEPTSPAQIQFRAFVRSMTREQLEALRFVFGAGPQYQTLLDAFEAEAKAAEAEETPGGDRVAPTT